MGETGPGEVGAQPASHSRWAATLGMLPHPPFWISGTHRCESRAVGCRPERALQPQTLGARPVKPGGFRRPLAWFPVQLGPPAPSVPSRRDLPQLGPSSQARVTWCRAALLWGRAGRQEQPGWGRGHTSQEQRESPRGAERALYMLDFPAWSGILPQLCSGSISYSQVYPPARPPVYSPTPTHPARSSGCTAIWVAWSLNLQG